MNIFKAISTLFSSRKKNSPTSFLQTLGNAVQLIPGQEYKVVKEFTDFDKIIHPVGETWIYNGTAFLPYEDGLTIFMTKNDTTISYRLQWRKEEQAAIIDNFSDFVEVC